MVYDYKTGKKGFSAEGVESGSDLQMLLYLFAECAKDLPAADVLPAGVSYVRAGAQPALKAESTEGADDAAQAKSWYSEHSLSGAVFDSPRVVSAFEKIEAALCEETDYRPKNGHNHLLKLSAARFGEFRSFVEKQVILPKIKSLLDGEISAVPLENDKKLPCVYCQFWACCGNRNGKFGSAVCTGSKVEDFETKKDA